MKRIISTFLLIFNSLFLWAYGGLLNGAEGKLNVIKTQYFDLIFPDKSEETALKIEAVCDSYYEKLCSLFEYEPYQKFSVVITDQVEISNAFFSLAPYNLIVIYDYPVSYGIDNQKYETEGVFYHELSHAVSLNSKSPFWRGLSVFGDLFTPAGISLTSFWYEGAAVAMESLEDGGRLNDPFFNQILLDAKFKAVTGEKKFPSWRDVTGSRDTYPSGNDAYVFGSHFALYLIKTYGMSKYAQFWQNAGSSTNLSFCAGVFKRTYGVTLTAAWKDFYESIELPGTDLLKRKDFVSKKNLFSKKGSVVQAADSFFNKEKGVYDIVFYDSQSQAVFYNSKRLFTIRNIQSLRFSDDGTKLFVNRIKDKDNIKNCDFIYDIKTKKRTNIEHDDLLFEKSHGASIKKEGLNWFFEYEDSASLQKIRLDLGQRILHHLHFVSEDDSTLTYVFTWAELFTKTLGRSGLVKINKDTLEAAVLLQKNDNPCGLVNTVPYGDSLSFLAVTEEYDSRPLRFLSLTEDDFEEIEVPADKTVVPQTHSYAPGESVAAETGAAEQDKAPETVPLSSPQKNHYDSYSPLRYYLRGVLLPLGTVTVYNHALEAQSSYLLGASFISSNPWVDKLIDLSLAFDMYTKSGGGLFSVSGGNDSFSYSLSSTAVFDANGFKQTYDEAGLAKVLWQGDVSSFSAGTDAFFLYGRDGLETETKKVKYIQRGLTFDSKPYLYFTNVHRVRPGYSQTTGISFKPFADIEYQKIKTEYENDSLPASDEEIIYYNAGVLLAFKFPGLFPLTLTAGLFPEKGCFSSFSSNLLLFSYDIHKGIPALSLFAQRLAVGLTYGGEFNYAQSLNWDIKRVKEIKESLTKDDYEDYLRLSLELQLSLNTSYFASSNAAGLSGFVEYSFNGKKKDLWKFGLYANVAW